MTEQVTIKERFEVFRDQWFPERQLFLRSEGRVNFITFSPNLQMAIAAGAIAAVLWTGVTSFSYMMRDSELAEREARIQQLADEKDTLDQELGTLQGELLERTEAIEKRQRLLEELNGVTPVSVPAEPDTESEEQAPDDTGSALQTISKFSLLSSPANAAELPAITRLDAVRDGLSDIEARQEALGQKMLADVTGTIADIDAILEGAALNTDQLIERAATLPAEQSGLGGPFEPLVKPDVSGLDLASGVLTDLVNERERLHLATLALDSLPVAKPAADYYVSSRFGTRRDPMTKRWASHKALDLAGWPGTAIQAAGAGKVVRAGWWGPYGNMVEIDHGNGYRTRYGHMRRLKVKKGEVVAPGQKLGEMGKTGRATSSHLHFEVWKDSEVTDPMPYLKASENVLKIKQRATGKADNQAG